MEVAAAETTVSFEAYNTHTSITPAVFSVYLSAQRIQTADINSGRFTFLVNGESVTAHSSFETTWVYPGTTLELSFSSRQTAFQFTGEGYTEITLPSEHTHVTVDGIETAVDIPGFTTTLTVTGSTNVIVNIPATTAQMTIPSVEHVFSVITASASKVDDTYYCGTFTDQTLDAGDTGSPCVMGALFTVTLPYSAPAFYVRGDGPTTSFALEGVTTSFASEQTFTTQGDLSTWNIRYNKLVDDV